MPFTNEEKVELVQLIGEAMDSQRERRRLQMMAEQEAKPKTPNTHLYLVSLPHHDRIALPDEKGRPIFHDAFYARITYDGKRFNAFIESEIKVVAFGDGKLLEQPLTVLLSSSPNLVLVEESLLTA